jgi:chorismate mutase/prephenate dehydratase
MPAPHDNTRPTVPPAPGTLSADLDSLRQRVDDIDQRIIQAISERARIIVEIGRTKQRTGAPIYAPHRERQVLDRVLALNPGPMTRQTIEAIYREIMSGSFKLELPLRVGYLGPAGSYSHAAATRHFGSSVEHVDLHDIQGVFDEVAAERCHYGLVPYENTIGGSITETLDAFQAHDITIYAETLIEVNHALLANCPPREIRRIFSKPQVFAQCRRWLSHQFPDAELLPETSSSAAVRRAAQEPCAAAIGSKLAGEIHGVNVIFENVQDKADNITRFLVIARQAALATGRDKTTILFTTADKPGALLEVLAVFRDADINLTHIAERPSGRRNWEYVFFIDCMAHKDDPPVARAIEAARAHCLSLRVLGSYPQAAAPP